MILIVIGIVNIRVVIEFNVVIMNKFWILNVSCLLFDVLNWVLVKKLV